MRPPKARRIVIAAYEGVSLLDLAGPLEAFQVASGFGRSRESRVTYECSVVSIRGGPLKTANGVELVTGPTRCLEVRQFVRLERYPVKLVDIRRLGSSFRIPAVGSS